MIMRRCGSNQPGLRRGMAALEAMLALLITLLLILMLFPILAKACYVLYITIGAMVGWPYL